MRKMASIFNAAAVPKFAWFRGYPTSSVFEVHDGKQTPLLCVGASPTDGKNWSEPSPPEKL
jgi:hypothetical protein